MGLESSTSSNAGPAQGPLNGGVMPGGGASGLLDAHKAATAGRGAGQEGRKRGPYNKGSATAPPPGPATPGVGLPPAVLLPDFFASAHGLVYSAIAALADDEDWNLTPEIKKEVGVILNWALADDFYKMGGVGKYVACSAMLISVFALQSGKTAKKRKARNDERKLLAEGIRKNPNPHNIPVKPSNEEKLSRPEAGFIPDPAKIPPTLPS